MDVAVAAADAGDTVVWATICDDDDDDDVTIRMTFTLSESDAAEDEAASV